MAADPSSQDPKALWKELEPETDPVTLEQVHTLARNFDRKARLALLIGPPALVFAAFIGGQQWQASHDALARTSVVLDIVGMLLSGWLIYRVIFPLRDPAEPAGAYLRSRLQRSLANARGGWLLTLIPLLPGAILGFYNAYGRHPLGPGAGPALVRLLPFLILILALVFVIVRARTGERALKAQLDEVDGLLKG